MITTTQIEASKERLELNHVDASEPWVRHRSFNLDPTAAGGLEIWMDSNPEDSEDGSFIGIELDREGAADFIVALQAWIEQL